MTQRTSSGHRYFRVGRERQPKINVQPIRQNPFAVVRINPRQFRQPAHHPLSLADHRFVFSLISIDTQVGQ
jgi:hypothetical protein